MRLNKKLLRVVKSLKSFLLNRLISTYIDRFNDSIRNLNKKNHVGDNLLSQEVALQVPSALTRLTSGFEMFPGIPTSLSSPT